MNTTRNRIIFVFCFFCFFQAESIQGQPVFFDVQEASKRYPDQSFIILSRNDQYSIKTTNGKLTVLRHRKEQYLYLKNMAAFNTERTLQSSSFVVLKDYKAKTYLPRGNKFKSIPVKNVSVRKSISGSVFYDDEEEYVFTFSGIEKGAVLEIESTHEINEPRFFPTLFFQSAVPVYSLQYSITCDTSVALTFAKFNMDAVQIENDQTFDKKQKVCRWSGENLLPIKDEPHQPSVRYFIAHTIPLIAEYIDESGERQPYLSSVEDLYQWYYTFIKDVNSTDTFDELKPLADSLTHGLQNDIEKAQAIFFWVQENIQYVAFEDGMGGLVPRNATEVYKKKYGDCKDKTSLLQVLMQNAGIDAYFCWIGSDELPYSYGTVYSPTVDNHMILATFIEGKRYFLDGTGSFQSMTLPTRFIQGKEALIAIDSNTFIIDTVPVIPATQNSITDSVLLRMDKNGNLSGSGTYSLSGYSKLYFQNSLIGKTSNEQKNSIDSYVQIGSNKCVLTDYSLPSIGTYDSSLTFAYSLSIEDYCQKYEQELFVNMNMYRNWTKFQIEEDRTTPMRFKFASSFQYTFCIEIPHGYEIASVPENSAFHQDCFSYTISYSIENNILLYRHHITVDTKLIIPDQFNSWRDFINSLKQQYRQNVVLKLKD